MKGLSCSIIVIILTASAAAWALYRIHRYPLAKGLRMLAVILAPPWLVPLPLIRIGNRLLRRLPLPRPLDGMRLYRISCKASDGHLMELIAYRPDADTPMPCLLYFHGGGFMFEAAPYIYRNMRAYAETGCMVVSVSYRTSDKSPFPSQFRDACDALMFILDNARALGIDSKRIAVGGDSAGGCLAAALAIWARDEEKARIIFQMLVYPVLDSSLTTASARQMKDSPLWNSRLSQRMWEIYLRDGLQCMEKHYASPSCCSDLSGLPPAYIEVCEYDSLRDEGLDFALRLEAAGVKAMVAIEKGACHGFDFLFHADISRKAIRRRTEALRRVLTNSSD